MISPLDNRDDRLRTWAQVVYVCYALWVFTGGVLGVVGVVIALSKRGDATGSFVASHFAEQIRIFVWGFVLSLVAVLLMLTLIGIPIALLLFFAIWVWTLWKAIVGWLRLADGRDAR